MAVDDVLPMLNAMMSSLLGWMTVQPHLNPLKPEAFVYALRETLVEHAPKDEARAAIMTPIDVENPAAIDPATNRTMAICVKSFLLNRSESFPQMGVAMVIANKLAVMTQVYSRCVPWRSAMMVGSAVETMVVEIIAVNRAARRPVITCRISRWEYALGVSVVSCGAGTSWHSPSRVRCLKYLDEVPVQSLEDANRLVRLRRCPVIQ